MCETLMPTIENDTWCEEGALAEDCVCVTYKTGDWQKMLRYLYDNHDKHNDDNHNDGSHVFIPAYPLAVIIESEVELGDAPTQVRSILMNPSDAKDVVSLATFLQHNSS